MYSTPDLGKVLTSRTGSILVLILCLLTLMSSFMLSVGFVTRQRLLVASRLESREKLRLIAEAGVKKGISVLREKDVQDASVYALNQRWSSNAPEFKNIEMGDGKFFLRYELEPGYSMQIQEKQFRYGMTDEERKINLNRIQSKVILQRLFQIAADVPEDEAQTIAESILDWRDLDDDPYQSGAESKYYQGLRPPYSPKNADLHLLEELRYIKGVTPKIFSRVRPFVTLDGDGKVNINTAPEVVLHALGLGQPVISKIITFRKGRDREEGTPDDRAFSDINNVSQDLNLESGEIENLQGIIDSGLLGIQAAHFSIQSFGTLDHRREALVIHAVVEKTGGIKHWQEEYVQVSAL